MSEQGNYNVLVEVKKTTIWLRKKDAEKPIDGRIKNQGVIMIENKIILIEDDKEIRGMINDYILMRKRGFLLTKCLMGASLLLPFMQFIVPYQCQPRQVMV